MIVRECKNRVHDGVIRKTESVTETADCVFENWQNRASGLRRSIEENMGRGDSPRTTWGERTWEAADAFIVVWLLSSVIKTLPLILL